MRTLMLAIFNLPLKVLCIMVYVQARPYLGTTLCRELPKFLLQALFLSLPGHISTSTLSLAICQVDISTEDIFADVQ